MKKLLKSFLNQYFELDYLNEEFDYNFNENSSREMFDNEFKKFLGINNSVFYDKNRLVTMFNSLEIRLNKNQLDQIIKLYFYTKSNKLSNENSLIIEFLYTYYRTINTEEYKDNYNKYSESQKDFLDLLNINNIRKEFFNSFLDECFNFYKKIIQYAIKNDEFIDGEIIYRIFNNLSYNSKKNEYNQLIDMLVERDKSLYNVVKFDREKKNHIEHYFKYIMDSLDSFGGYNYAKEMIVILDIEKALDDIFLKQIINRYIKICNKLCEKLKDKKYSFIQGLAELENLKEELNYILNNAKTLTYIEKEKIHECLIQILNLKRFIVSDEEYSIREMHEFKYEQKIPSIEVDKIRESLINNCFLLYSVSKIDFVNQIGTALDMYSKYPLGSTISTYHIDSKKQTYSIGIEINKNAEKNNFKKIFDEIGREYTKNHNSLMNKLNSDYYEELLRYLSKTFLMQQNFIVSIMGKDEIYKLLNTLKEKIDYEFENEYAIIASNVLAIETNIINLLKIKKIKYTQNGVENINALVKCYDKEKNKDILNGLMYINYILYEKNGLNLRNSILHGSLINTDLIIPLITTYSGLIFVSWMKNAKK